MIYFRDLSGEVKYHWNSDSGISWLWQLSELTQILCWFLVTSDLHVLLLFKDSCWGTLTYDLAYVIFTLLELILVIQQRVSYSLLWSPNHIDELNSITRI